jgi:riboflavin synthase
MFAGIIEALGTVTTTSATPRRQVGGGAAYRLEIELGALLEGMALGASVAVNGVCLTLAERRGVHGAFDVVPETWSRTTLARLQPGATVNLERSLRVGDRIDGHFVQGHVEGVGTVDRLERNGGEWKLWVQSPAELRAAIVPKGSIALDGTSLTIVDVEAERFSVALVPTTLRMTVLGQRQPGAPLNIETDILARIVLAQLARVAGGALAQRGAPRGVQLEDLQAGGFLA